MCGRFTRKYTWKEIYETYQAIQFYFDIVARYNITPTQEVGVVRSSDAGREFVSMRWGLLPRWTKDIKTAPMLNNARAETIAEKPSFREAYKSRRCIIPASGFYEWQTEGNTKQPFYFQSPEGRLLSFAGIWERWNDIETCAIVTTDANEIMAPVHHRMPVILGANDYQGWLDPSSSDVSHMLAPCPSSELTCYPVSTYVNKAGNEGPQCVEPVEVKSEFLFD
jgi:putative SOS response-associated peptidase YedK